MNLSICLYLLIFGELLSIIQISLLLNIGKIRGQAYCKITSKSIKASSEIVVQCMIMLLVGGYSIYCCLINKDIILKIIVANLFLILPFVQSILRIKNYSVVTTKGIMLNNRFCKWKYIKRYQWMNENSVKFFMKYKNGTHYEESFENIEMSRNILEEILKKEIKDMSCEVL